MRRTARIASSSSGGWLSTSLRALHPASSTHGAHPLRASSLDDASPQDQYILHSSPNGTITGTPPRASFAAIVSHLASPLFLPPSSLALSLYKGHAPEVT